MKYPSPTGKEGATIPGLATRSITNPEQTGQIRDKWFAAIKQLTERQVIDAFTKKLSLYPVRGEARRQSNGCSPMSVRQRAIKTVDSFSKLGGSLPTKNAFEVIERAVAGEQQRGPTRPQDPATDATDSDTILEKIFQICASDFDSEFKLELIRGLL